MQPHQMMDYFGGQCGLLVEELHRALRAGDREAIEARRRHLAPRLEYLRGYATAMEHAGLLQKPLADQVFAALECK
ncbi:MAG: hypothetical protein ACTHL1_10475 [Burkholderiaceae bacterium]